MMKKHQRQELEESIQRDAARYRWLKERHTGGSEIGVWRETKEGMALKGGWLCGIELDEAVDYAMTLTPNAEVRGDAPLYGAASLSTDGLCSTVEAEK
jgi:hypothetical protein